MQGSSLTFVILEKPVHMKELAFVSMKWKYSFIWRVAEVKTYVKGSVAIPVACYFTYKKYKTETKFWLLLHMPVFGVQD